ncbi:hypothetical protein CYMTET_32329 [Cymbomonas tetramitiformis]|uniref:Uncharacterized protein n=1 Tax=Cymbomonas tetramitiformis TaxID=36881 RepID=A0AAE0KSB6_9CHLO|nr:hypothetical protein CYMTET_32329 [Cymbomonas tetramitiformis]
MFRMQRRLCVFLSVCVVGLLGAYLLYSGIQAPRDQNKFLRRRTANLDRISEKLVHAEVEIAQLQSEILHASGSPETIYESRQESVTEASGDGVEVLPDEPSIDAQTPFATTHTQVPDAPAAREDSTDEQGQSEAEVHFPALKGVKAVPMFPSLGKVQRFDGGDLEIPEVLEAALMARSFNQEIIFFITDLTFSEMALNLVYNFQELGMEHYLIITGNREVCDSLLKGGLVTGCAWSSYLEDMEHVNRVRTSQPVANAIAVSSPPPGASAVLSWLTAAADTPSPPGV